MPGNKTLAVSRIQSLLRSNVSQRVYQFNNNMPNAYDRIYYYYFKALSFFRVGCHEKKFPNANNIETILQPKLTDLLLSTVIHVFTQTHTHVCAYRQKPKYLSRVVHSETFNRIIFSHFILTVAVHKGIYTYYNYLSNYKSEYLLFVVSSS